MTSPAGRSEIIRANPNTPARIPSSQSASPAPRLISGSSGANPPIENVFAPTITHSGTRNAREDTKTDVTANGRSGRVRAQLMRGEPNEWPRSSAGFARAIRSWGEAGRSEPKASDDRWQCEVRRAARRAEPFNDRSRGAKPPSEA